MSDKVQVSPRKEWRQPELRKLPIAATAQEDGPTKSTGNEGQGGGKGDGGAPAGS